MFRIPREGKSLDGHGGPLVQPEKNEDRNAGRIPGGSVTTPGRTVSRTEERKQKFTGGERIRT